MHGHVHICNLACTCTVTEYSHEMCHRVRFLEDPCVNHTKTPISLAPMLNFPRLLCQCYCVSHFKTAMSLSTSKRQTDTTWLIFLVFPTVNRHRFNITLRDSHLFFLPTYLHPSNQLAFNVIVSWLNMILFNILFLVYTAKCCFI